MWIRRRWITIHWIRRFWLVPREWRRLRCRVGCSRMYRRVIEGWVARGGGASGELLGFFPFDFAQGQNDGRLWRQDIMAVLWLQAEVRSRSRTRRRPTIQPKELMKPM